MFQSLLGVAEMELTLRGSVDMASSTRADIDAGPPGYVDPHIYTWHVIGHHDSHMTTDSSLTIFGFDC